MAGLWVGQAFGMFLLPGFGVGSSNPWVPNPHVQLRHYIFLHVKIYCAYLFQIVLKMSLLKLTFNIILN